MTRVAYYATLVQAETLHRREELLAAYERLPDTSMYWAFVDLVASSNFRLAQGPKEGYVRGETFFTLVGTAIAPYGVVRRIKEMGDGVLLASPELRPLFESCVLIGQVAHQLANIAGDEQYPFSVRLAVGYGPAKRLPDRPADDFLGSPIDALARLAGMAAPNELLVSEEAYEPNRGVLSEYGFARFDGPHQVSEAKSKGMIHPVRYRTVVLDRASLSAHEAGFAEWAQSAGKSSSL